MTSLIPPKFGLAALVCAFTFYAGTLHCGPALASAAPAAKVPRAPAAAPTPAPEAAPTVAPKPTPKTGPALPKPGEPNFALRVLTHFDDLYRGRKSVSVMAMTIQTKHWRRTLKMKSWTLGTEYSLVRILAPKKERGTATLKAGKDLYTYLNKTGRVIKVGGGMMGGSWMGSHLTNDDLVRETRLSEDFKISRLPDAKVGATPCWVFELVPKPNVAIVWGKVRVTVRQSDAQPMQQQFYDEEGKLNRTMHFRKHTRVGDRVMPLIMRMEPNDGSKEFTEVRMSDFDFNVKLDRAFFSLQRLKSL